MCDIKDSYGRTFRTLRVSLLQHCNLACVYCVSGEEELLSANAPDAGRPLEVSELLRMIGRLHQQLKLTNVRLTGGEPLLYAGLASLVSGIRELGELDAVDEAIFFRMTRRHSAGRIIGGIDAAIAAELDVKLNAVIMKGCNDSEVLALLDLAASRGLRIRFLEVMAMGHLHDTAARHLLSQGEILRIIGGRHVFEPMPREPSATARYWRTSDGHVFGIIANQSEPFCRDCDRLRLDSSGRIYGCLSSNEPIALSLDEEEQEWSRKLASALLQKQPLRFTGSGLSMLHIGG